MLLLHSQHNVRPERRPVSTFGYVKQVDERGLPTLIEDSGHEMELRFTQRAAALSSLFRTTSEQPIFVAGYLRYDSSTPVFIELDEDSLIERRDGTAPLKRLLFDLLEKDKIGPGGLWAMDAFAELFRVWIAMQVKTLRDAKRYHNSLLSSLPPVAAEVNLFDFCVLEVLKVFAPWLYDDIYQNRQFYAATAGYDRNRRIYCHDKIFI